MGVLAGCPIAMGALLLASMDPMEEFMKTIPAQLKVTMAYVDDFNLTFRFVDGLSKTTIEFITHQVNITYRRMQDELKTRGGLLVSIDKNKITSNCQPVLDRLEKIMSDVAPEDEPLTHPQLVKLGVDYAAGKPVKYTKAKERLKKASLRTTALLGYCKKGWKTTNIVKAHVMGGTMYGARILGVKPDHLAKIRTLIRSTTTSTIGGSSATTVLALQKCKLLDPAYKAVELPIL